MAFLSRRNGVISEIEGVLWAWGDNSCGQLGVGTTENSPVPVAVDFMKARAIVAGSGCAFALRENGHVWAWGSNDFGKLGDSTDLDRLAPVHLRDLPGITELAAGARTTYALTNDGTVLAWGGNVFHELGLGRNSSIPDSAANPEAFQVRAISEAERGSMAPVEVLGLPRIQRIFAGGARAYALDIHGNLWAWGDNQRGRLGVGTEVEHRGPVQVSSLPPIVSMAAAETSAFALDVRGDVWAWGDNTHGQLGNGSNESRSFPQRVTGLPSIESLAAGHSSIFAVSADGEVWGWGRNSSGQLGIGNQTDARIAVRVEGVVNVKSVAAGANSAYALTNAGHVWAWGDNGYGQLGDPNRIDSLRPFRLDGLNAVMGVIARKHSIYAITDGTQDGAGYVKPAAVAELSVQPSNNLSLGSVWSWGNNLNGNLGDGSRDNRLVPTQVEGLSNVTDVSFGGGSRFFGNDRRVRALCEGGSVWAWGGPIFNEELKGDRSPKLVFNMEDVVSIVDGFAVKSDGAVWDLRVLDEEYDRDPKLVEDLEDVKALYSVGPLLYVVNQGGSTSVIETSEYGWVYRGLSRTEGGPRAFGAPAGIKEIVTWADFEGESSWDEGTCRFDVGLTDEGNVWHWQVKNFGTTGRNEAMSRIAIENDPSRIAGLTKVQSIKSGAGFCVALQEDGTVWTWGTNKFGQLGNGTNDSSFAPARVNGLVDIIAIETHGASCFALSTTGVVCSWGKNDEGQLGDGTNVARNSPVPIKALSDVSSLYAGFAIQRDGTLWTWGSNEGGRLGDGTQAGRNLPKPLQGLTNVVKVVSRDSAWYALTSLASDK